MSLKKSSFSLGLAASLIAATAVFAGCSKSKNASLDTVMRGEEGFLFVTESGSDEKTIEDVPALFDPNDDSVKIWDFAPLDLDGDGENEVVLSVFGAAGDMGGHLILHEEDGQIYGYKLDGRTLVNLKSDGTGDYSDPTGFSEIGVCKIDDFTAAGYDLKKLFYATGTYQGMDNFVVSEQPATEQEFDAENKKQMEKSDAVWYDFTSENINDEVIKGMTGTNSSSQDFMDVIESESTQNDSPRADYANYDKASMQSAASDFAVRLLQETAQDGKSTLVSPWSVITALGMAENGAAGDTLGEMSGVLGAEPDELGAYLRDYADSIEDDECLHEANGIWMRDDENLVVEAGFLQKTADYYGANVKTAPFDGGTVEDINLFVEENTDGQVKKIIEDLSDDAMLVLVNALGLDAEWESIYREDQVDDGEFVVADGTVRDKVPFMYSEEGAFLRDGSDAMGFLKYYKGHRLAFAAMLPSEGESADAYLAGLTGERLEGVINGAEEGIVLAGIPKFKCKGHYKLRDALSAMGMPRAFTSDADFSAMGHYADTGLYISDVLHETSIAVDERGTKAGAATAVEMMEGSTMSEDIHEVVLNRPFVYMLVDTECNMPLFIGTFQGEEL